MVPDADVYGLNEWMSSHVVGVKGNLTHAIHSGSSGLQEALPSYDRHARVEAALAVVYE